MKIFKLQPYRVQHHPCNLSTILYHISNGHLDLNAYYQRDYVWTEKDQENFLSSVFSDKPIGSICVTIRDPNKDGDYIEVVDGKQRITTLKLFFENKIDYKGYFWDDLDREEKNMVKRVKIGWMELSSLDEREDLDEKVILEYFHDVNFMGVPQSKEHHDLILKLIEEA